jgi:hypothetical protein
MKQISVKFQSRNFSFVVREEWLSVTVLACAFTNWFILLYM